MTSNKTHKAIALQNRINNLPDPDDEALLKEFMKERDFPDWFRGLSQFQLDAADSLLNSIRDDSEQGTAHRVRDNLIKLGIQPLISTSKIKYVMRLSRGNDMAFLWFLMELYYRDSCAKCEHTFIKPVKYSLTEQVFMSTIAHLDTITTLRELDRLLPKQPQQIKKKPIKKKKKKEQCILPYFETQRRPVSYGKKLTLSEGMNCCNFGDYDNYLDPNYVVYNECNRWYADYNLNQSKRIAQRIVSDQVKAVLEDDLEVPSSLHCAHHDNIKTKKESMFRELQVARKKVCEKYFDLDGQLKDQSCKRVVEQLNEEFAKAEENIHKFTTQRISEGQGMSKLSHNSETTQKPSAKSISERQECYKELLEKYDFGHAVTPIGNGTYFEAPTWHKPFKFNYNKIFDMGPRDEIKDAVTAALDAGSDTSLENNRAVRKCCKDIWRDEVKRYRDEYMQKRRELKKQPPPEPEVSGLNFNLPYYDPHDKKLMRSMICAAFNEMKKDKKFVLATMPDAYKYPLIKEWCKKRYGFGFEREEKKKNVKVTKKVFFVLNKDNRNRTKLPELYNLSKKRDVSYACKNYIFRKTNYLKDKYNHNFKANFLETVRIYWGAVRPHQCPQSQLRKIFFAYLPARETDIHMFRPWMKKEFVPAKQELDKRKRKQRMQFVYVPGAGGKPTKNRITRQKPKEITAK